jgi:hypothetical protein
VIHANTNVFISRKAPARRMSFTRMVRMYIVVTYQRLVGPSRSFQIQNMWKRATRMKLILHNKDVMFGEGFLE